MYNLYCKFDLKKHMEKYINYLEVVVHKDGTVEYAVPSHQEKLVSIGMKKYNMNREDFVNMCPEEMWADYLTWLCNMTECVVVWSHGYYHGTSKISEEQHKVLKEFIRHGVMANKIATLW